MVARLNTPTPTAEGDTDLRPTARPPVEPEQFAASLMALVGSDPPPADSQRPTAIPAAARVSPTGVELEYDACDTEPEPDGFLEGLAEQEPEACACRMREAFEAGDYEGALFLAEELLSCDPSRREPAEYADASRGLLEQMYVAQLGDSAARPVLSVDDARAQALEREPRMAFLLALMDGEASVADIAEVCGSRRIEALRLMVSLLREGAIRMLPVLRRGV